MPYTHCWKNTQLKSLSIHGALEMEVIVCFIAHCLPLVCLAQWCVSDHHKRCVVLDLLQVRLMK